MLFHDLPRFLDRLVLETVNDLGRHYRVGRRTCRVTSLCHRAQCNVTKGKQLKTCGLASSVGIPHHCCRRILNGAGSTLFLVL